MKDSVKLKDSFISIDNEKFLLKSKNASLALSFSENFGFVIDSFKNTAGKREVEYINASQPFMPLFPENEEETSTAKSAELVNAMTRVEEEKSNRIIGDASWSFLGAKAENILYGGAHALGFTASVKSSDSKVTVNAVVFPECSVIRYRFDIENLTDSAAEYKLTPFSMALSMDRTSDIYRAAWFCGGAANHNYGKLNEQAFGMRVPKLELSSRMTANYLPMLICYREGAPRDGVMIEMDYAAFWNLSVERVKFELLCKFGIDNGNAVRVEAGESISTPIITIAAYAEDMDELMVTLYDWQYTYMWEYTQNEYYGKYRSQSMTYPWVYCSRILNEQFTYRLACMDMLGSKDLAAAGVDMSWDDAGWSTFPGYPPDEYMSVFKNTYEGPDHRLSTRYFEKLGMKRLIWFAGKPSPELLGTKEGAWGEFEWRTDEVYNTDFRSEAAFKKKVKTYLDGGLRRSFHTCSGGATYCGTFDIQHYANYHYASDNGMGPCSLYYFSYFFLTDRWGDTLPGLGGEFYATDGSHSFQIKSDNEKWYNPDFARGNLIMNGKYAPANAQNEKFIREDTNIYNYLRSKGVAGRWSYMFHPGIYGDRDIYYMQRTSHDRLRAAIIIRRRPEGRVVIYPKGLIENENYTVSFDICKLSFTKTGKELMEEGFVIKDVAPREVIYLNLPDAPSKASGVKPPKVKRVICKKETNVGTSGIGIYWSAQSDNLRYYEIARDGAVIAKSASFRYYFDTDSDFGGEAKYSVRAVGYGDSVGEWVDAEYLDGSSVIYSTLGANGDDFAKMNWSAETSEDLKAFAPMRWVAPAGNPGADLGGTPNQEGGIEGYFEGAQCAKVGRGWQQASPDAYCVRSFTAPFSGEVTLTGRAVKEWYHSEYGSDLEVCVMKNGETLVPFTTIRRSDIDGLSYNLKLEVKKGDILRFVLGKCDAEHNADIHYEKDANIVGWNTIVEYKVSQKESDNFICRINAGGSECADNTGAIWSADRYYLGGEKSGNESELFGSARADESISYKIPVPTGIYAVRLLFCETEYTAANERFMELKINGSTYEEDLDIAHSARGVNKPFTKVYHYVVPDENGEIKISLSSKKGGAILSGIEIIPERDDVYHINCGGEDFVDWAGYVWLSDRCFEGGEAVSDTPVALKQASPTLYDKALYFTGRAGTDFSYRIPVRDGVYSVQLKFAELSLTLPETRPVDIYLNGVIMKENYDPVRAAEDSPMSADIRFDDVSSKDGAITVRVTSRSEKPAILRAIEID